MVIACTFIYLLMTGVLVFLLKMRWKLELLLNYFTSQSFNLNTTRHALSSVLQSNGLFFYIVIAWGWFGLLNGEKQMIPLRDF